MGEYPRTLEAVERAELSLWPVVDALVDEVATTPGGSARNGEHERVAEYLAANGYRTWSAARVMTLYGLGRWADENPRAGREDFRAYPVERVIEARKAAKSNHAKAIELLASVKSKRDLRPDKATPRQVVAALSDPDTRQRVIEAPGGVSAITRAHIDVEAARPPRHEIDPLPSTSRFSGDFWRAVQAVDSAYEQMEKFGVGALSLEPDAREAALRLQHRAAEISAAVIEDAIEASLQKEV